MSLRKKPHTPGSIESLWAYVGRYDGEVSGTYTKKSDKVFHGLFDHVTKAKTGEQFVRFRDASAVDRAGTPAGIYVNRLITPNDVARGAVSLLTRRRISLPRNGESPIPPDIDPRDIVRRREAEILGAMATDGFNEIHGSFDEWPELPEVEDELLSTRPVPVDLPMDELIRSIRDQ
ncbi:MAG TPA: hypothetical protein VIH90_04280 [Candidatus Saccharimonadales bacterium]